MNPVVMSPVAAGSAVRCTCGNHAMNIGVQGRQVVQQLVPTQHIQHHCSNGVQQLVPMQHVRHIHHQPMAVVGVQAPLVQQVLVPTMQHVQYVQQQPAVLVGVSPCPMQMVHMQPGMVTMAVPTTTMVMPQVGVATAVYPMTTTHYCQGGVGMVQMPMSIVGAPQVVSSMAVPVQGQVIGEVDWLEHRERCGWPGWCEWNILEKLEVFGGGRRPTPETGVSP
ncbi:hypothetical protein QBC39DRAFT_328536 [Podospora conica]|nr:hypothetical protein QBC39DRAFT_328536 [Schizothecium conicum]